MTTGRTALAAAVARLRAAGVPDAAGDARRLLAHALDCAPARLLLELSEPLPKSVAARFEADIAARAARRPVAQIIGARDFFGRRFRVTPDVLDPRPETETLVLAALEVPFATVIDLGTGSGAILVTLLAERPQARGIGTDLSAAALEVARHNAAALGVGDRARFMRAHWYDGLAAQADLIVSNPPYIAASEIAGLDPEPREHEPRIALTDGGDGLAAYRAIAADARAHLCARGRLMVEIGPTQADDVRALMRAAGLRDIALRRDLDGRARVISARAP